MIEKIIYDDNILAIILRKDYSSEGISFFSPESFSLQMGYMQHGSGHKIQPHVHNKVKREVLETQEVLFLKNGKINIDFYSSSKDFLESRELNAGDIILLASGGHGITMLEKSEIVEIKTGPYLGTLDKERF